MTTKYVSRFREKYNKEIIPEMMKKFKYTSPMQVPKVEKIVLNVGLGEATENNKLLDGVVAELTAITGQKAVITRSKKDISNFKIRKGSAIGARVTLRGDRMLDFLDRFINVDLPRARDFKGLAGKLFDGGGNCTIGLKEQVIFPELDIDKTEQIHGMDITIVTTAKKDEDAKAVLELFGMPFKK
ncbi:MAG: 50S ribosomal protein L5 [Candidatus Firestonebacteria bacterium]